MASSFKSEFPLVPRDQLKKMLKPENHKKFTKRYLANENLDSHKRKMWVDLDAESREGIIKRLMKHFHKDNDKVRAMLLAYAYNPDAK